MRYAGATALGVAALAVGAAGCGGGGASPAATKWASNMCASMSTWKATVDAMASDVTRRVSSPTASDRKAVEAAIRRGVEATRALATRLTTIHPPLSDQGPQAESVLRRLALRLRLTAARVENAVRSVPAHPTVAQVVLALSGVAAALEASIRGVGETLDEIHALGGDLRKGLDEAGACTKLRTELEG